MCAAAYNAAVSRSTVVIELAVDAQFARALAAGGVFVPGCPLRLADECDLVVRGAHHDIVVPARVVYVDERRGAGLELVGFSPEMKAQLAELEPLPFALEEPVFEDVPIEDTGVDRVLPRDDELRGPIEPAPLIVLEALDDEPAQRGGDDLTTDVFPQVSDDGYVDLSDIDWGGPTPADVDPEVYSGGGDTQRAHREDLALLAETADGLAEEVGEAGRARRESSKPIARNVHERLRGLNLAAQIKMAVSGELHERIVLERLYGKNVWETLLRNPRLTPPEVSRIARYGSLPRVLLELIVANNTWLQVPEIRRALLSNPRLAVDQVIKVLRLTPKHELKLAAIQTAYPATVRNAAKQLLRGP